MELGMTKNELKKEAYLYAKNSKDVEDFECGFDIAFKSYLASAEPREKRIAELEKENELLKADLEFTAKTSNKNKQTVKECSKLVDEYSSEGADLQDSIKELEKENAELKEKCQNRCDECWEEHIKLTKAKEALESISKLASNLYASGYSSKKIAECIQDKAVQFLQVLQENE